MEHTLSVAKVLGAKAYGDLADRRRSSRQTGKGVSYVLMMPLLRITVTKNPSGEWSVTITLGLM